jgi:hypothetical protein
LYSQSVNNQVYENIIVSVDIRFVRAEQWGMAATILFGEAPCGGSA